jgi:hypothetical protein
MGVEVAVPRKTKKQIGDTVDKLAKKENKDKT